MKANNGLKVADHGLTEEEKASFTRCASLMRKQLLERAHELTDEQIVEQAAQSASENAGHPKLHLCSKLPKEATKRLEVHPNVGNGLVPARRKRLNKRQLCGETVKNILSDVLTKKSTHHEAAIKFRVGRGLVGRLVRAFKTNPDYIDELHAKEDAVQQKIEAVVSAAKQIHARDGSIRKMAFVQEQVE